MPTPNTTRFEVVFLCVLCEALRFLSGLMPRTIRTTAEDAEDFAEEIENGAIIKETCALK
jgi:hypothetical protein